MRAMHRATVHVKRTIRYDWRARAIAARRHSVPRGTIRPLTTSEKDEVFGFNVRAVCTCECPSCLAGTHGVCGQIMCDARDA